MKQTEVFKLNLPEQSDPLSLKPLNENAEIIEAALAGHAVSIAGKLMMAKGTYTGDGTRVVTIQTPGFKAQAVLMRDVKKISNGYPYENSLAIRGGWVAWFGADMEAEYDIWARADEVSSEGDEPGELRRDMVRSTIYFSPRVGECEWWIASHPSKYYDVQEDNGPMVVNNEKGRVYEWVAFGTAEE